MIDAFLVFHLVNSNDNELGSIFVDTNDIKEAEEKKEQIKTALLNEGQKPEDIYIQIISLDENQSAVYRGFRK